MLFRATRGNMYLRNATVGSVVDPITGEKQEKAVFVVFFAGERARTKILKVPCLGIAIALHMCPWVRGGGGTGVIGALSSRDARGRALSWGKKNEAPYLR